MRVTVISLVFWPWLCLQKTSIKLFSAINRLSNLKFRWKWEGNNFIFFSISLFSPISPSWPWFGPRLNREMMGIMKIMGSLSAPRLLGWPAASCPGQGVKVEPRIPGPSWSFWSSWSSSWSCTPADYLIIFIFLSVSIAPPVQSKPLSEACVHLSSPKKGGRWNEASLDDSGMLVTAEAGTLRNALWHPPVFHWLSVVYHCGL